MVSLRILAAALFSTQAIAGWVRTIHGLDLTVHVQSDGWLRVLGPDDFDAELKCDWSDKTIQINNLDNTESNVKDTEAILSIWEHHTESDAGEVRHIQYDNIAYKSVNDILDSIWEWEGEDVSADFISANTISRPEEDETSWRWSSLRSTRFGSDAIDICSDFEETQDLYIKSFTYGKDGAFGRWLRVNFEKWQPQIE
ncbi:hypothetical protein BROUX41_006183 [Berkeleyomyces rouxiae]|uniref:uncharacterized protein n=1 Tax=Berkeleyomyces rouxiae TaxID=2035830 RepID=UPI003B81CC53